MYLSVIVSEFYFSAFHEQQTYVLASGSPDLQNQVHPCCVHPAAVELFGQ